MQPTNYLCYSNSRALFFTGGIFYRITIDLFATGRKRLSYSASSHQIAFLLCAVLDLFARPFIIFCYHVTTTVRLLTNSLVLFPVLAIGNLLRLH